MLTFRVVLPYISYRFIKRLRKVLEKVFPSSGDEILTTKINELMV